MDANRIAYSCQFASIVEQFLAQRSLLGDNGSMMAADILEFRSISTVSVGNSSGKGYFAIRYFPFLLHAASRFSR